MTASCKSFPVRVLFAKLLDCPRNPGLTAFAIDAEQLGVVKHQPFTGAIRMAKFEPDLFVSMEGIQKQHVSWLDILQFAGVGLCKMPTRTDIFRCDKTGRI